MWITLKIVFDFEYKSFASILLRMHEILLHQFFSRKLTKQHTPIHFNPYT